MFGRLFFDGRELVETGHFRHELYDVYRKTLDFVMHLLETGVHEKESGEKFRVEKKSRRGTWELVY